MAPSFSLHPASPGCRRSPRVDGSVDVPAGHAVMALWMSPLLGVLLSSFPPHAVLAQASCSPRAGAAVPPRHCTDGLWVLLRCHPTRAVISVRFSIVPLMWFPAIAFGCRAPGSSSPQAAWQPCPSTAEHPHLSPGPLTSSCVPGLLRFKCVAGTVVVLEGHPCSCCATGRAVTAA